MASAYIKDEQGGTFIPASQRPDGTWRKPRRVRDGYVPQEEVPLYESKGKQFVKNQPTYPVGMSAEYITARKAKKEAQTVKSSPIPGLVIQNDSKKKKKKNKNKSTDAIAEELAKTRIAEPECKKQQSASNNSKSQSADSSKVQSPNESQSSVDPAKKLKNLKKKMREIEVLEQKIKTNEIKKPDNEMLNKVSRKSDILREIKQLETEQ